jgi:hypothetical protein
MTHLPVWLPFLSIGNRPRDARAALPSVSRSTREFGTVLLRVKPHFIHLLHGAPLRLRVERQVGYKMAKSVRPVEVQPVGAATFAAKAAVGPYWNP